MNTNELERQLRSALRETLEAEQGPHPAWAESPVARRVAELDRSRRRWPLRVLAVAAVIGAVGGTALLAGAPDQPTGYSNGWIAYTVFNEDPAGGDPDTDVWLAALGQQPRRVIGSDTDGVDQACPAFSPDGRSLAYGSVEGLWSTMTADVAKWPAYRNAALVIADVADDGTVTDRLTIDIGDGKPPPCPVWSPDGNLLAFGVPLTSPGNPLRSGEGSEVWILRPADGDVTVIPDLLATDLEWSPDGSMLAIASGVDELVYGRALQDGRISVYAPSSGEMRSIDGTLGAISLTWAPDGDRIAYMIGDSATAPTELRVLDVETGEQEVLAAGFDVVHGIGPVWSPDGETIAYQRIISGTGEEHEVVLVTPDDRSERTGLANEVVMPPERTTADGSSVKLWPRRVTWSPDGTYLLYGAWTETPGQTLMVAVPTDPDAPAVILAENILSNDSGDTMQVPFQAWQRRPADAAMLAPTTVPN